MRLCVLGSGSSGNSVYVESGKTRVLFDAGFSSRELKRRMTAQGLDPAGLSAIVISHEHSDHVNGLRVMGRHFPVYATAGTLEQITRFFHLDGGTEVIAAGERFTIGRLNCLPLPLPHDAAEPVGFVIEDSSARIALITDLGVVPRLLRVSLDNLDLAVIEANHDPDLLLHGPYPWEIKQRVKSRLGHLANAQAADLISALSHPGLRHVLLAHLSQTNNQPELAQAAVQPALDLSRTRLLVCFQNQPSDIIKI